MPSLLLILALALPPVQVSVYPPVQMAPAVFRARATIERNPDNRLLMLEFDGPEFKRSFFQIDGAQRQFVFQPDRPWTLRSAGEYVATATLIRIEGGRERTYVATQPFRVIGLF